jgi:hypothetical protein
LRRSGTALATTVLVALTALVAAPASAHHRAGPCDFHRRDGETVRALSKRRIGCAVRRFGPVPGDAARAICIARRESGLDPAAVSEPKGLYVGLYQHAREYWRWRYETFTRRRWDLPRRALNGRTNAIVAIRMVVHFGRWRDAGWPRKRC